MSSSPIEEVVDYWKRKQIDWFIFLSIKFQQPADWSNVIFRFLHTCLFIVFGLPNYLFGDGLSEWLIRLTKKVVRQQWDSVHSHSLYYYLCIYIVVCLELANWPTSWFLLWWSPLTLDNYVNRNWCFIFPVHLSTNSLLCPLTHILCIYILIWSCSHKLLVNLFQWTYFHYQPTNRPT